MASTLEIDHKEMHDIRSAAELSGYSRDHVTSLARGNKIVAAQIGRQWYVDLDSLQQYAHITQLEQKVKQKHLGEERKSNRELIEKLEEGKNRKVATKVQHAQKIKTSALALLLLATAVGTSLGFYSPEVFNSISEQVASAPGSTQVQTLATDGELLIPVSPVTQTTFSDGSVQVSTLAEPQQAIVLLPTGLTTSTEVFSDEVRVVQLENGVKKIFLSDDSEEEGVSFVEVPVSTITTP